ncbi:hypothetical protein [Micromonospora antibiotica]|uniref:Nucleopolyhedrovirus P10 family protein n=1 Tax=Micromonospora antibiotica TaxID=2807623 RepID=A0ABS3V9A0_9ACTN|nr:hypothetical protein [Micromonospora antibiotica]MBO4162191.1 hypothetical protein [Micromonospora antibiotica]
MRGGLDETLARLARREEARRRRSTDQGAEADDGVSTLAFTTTGRATTEPVHPATAPTGPAHPVPPAGPGRPGAAPAELVRAGPGSGEPAAGGSDPVEEVAEAVRRVVAAHPGLTVALRVEYAGRTYPLRIERTEPGARNERTEPGARNERAEPGVRGGSDPRNTAPPAWPLAERTPTAWTPARELPGVDPAARLAELIRRDPTLLDHDG